MARRVVSVLGWLGGHAPTVLAWAGLIGLAVFGSLNGWSFSDEPGGEKEKKAKVEKSAPDNDGSFKPYLLEQPNDVPVEVSHDPNACKLVSWFASPEAAAAVLGVAVGLEHGGKRVAFRSPEAMEKAGIKTAPVVARELAVRVTAHGEAMQDPTAVARVAPRVGGVIVRMTKQLGDPVRRGEVLALLDAADVGKSKAGLLTARANFQSRQLVRDSLQPGVAPERSILEAENALRDARVALYGARQTLVNLGLPLPAADDDRLPDEAFSRRLQFLGLPFFTRLELLLAESLGHTQTANLLPVVSPLDGVVMKQTAVVGEPVPALGPLYEVGDPIRVDVFLEVRQEDVPLVAVGQSVTFRIEGAPTVGLFLGTIDWVSSALDEKTRTVRVRTRVANPSGVLKSQTFGDGTIRIGSTTAAPVVPVGAAHWEGCCHVVFVKQEVPNKDDPAKKDVVFEPRCVSLGAREGGYVEVRSGLQVGEQIAVEGSHVLKCELLKDRIGEADE